MLLGDNVPLWQEHSTGSGGGGCYFSQNLTMTLLKYLVVVSPYILGDSKLPLEICRAYTRALLG